MFWLGICIGYVIGNIVCFLLELLCIAKDKNIDKYMEGDNESSRS